MDNLWTPWRFHYISSTLGQEGCVFCNILGDGSAADRKNLILSRRDHNMVIMNRFPYTSGHLMIVLFRHVAALEKASAEELKELIGLAAECESALREVFRPDGFNMGFNLGKCAGAGVDGHLHLHIVPRWVGDANVVSIVGQTRIIPEELETTFDKLQPFLENAEIDKNHSSR
jgi:ATP adenylyltransferase